MIWRHTMLVIMTLDVQCDGRRERGGDELFWIGRMNVEVDC